MLLALLGQDSHELLERSERYSKLEVEFEVGNALEICP